MATNFTLKIKIPRSREDLKKDAEILIKRFAIWGPVAVCPGGMEIIIFHNYGKDTLEVSFCRLSPKSERGIKFGHIDFYISEIHQLLIRMNLFQYYEISEAFVGSYKLHSPPDHNGFFLTENTKENDYEISIKAIRPGLKLTLLQKNSVNLSSETMIQHMSKLVNLLNSGANTLIINIQNEKFISFPAVLLKTQQRSIQIAIAASGMNNYIPHTDLIVKEFNTYLYKVGLGNLYFVSQPMWTPDLTIDDRYLTLTENQSLLDKLNSNKFKIPKIPEHYFCGITSQIMDEVVKIPAYDGFVDRGAINQIITNSGQNPYTREKLSYDDIKCVPKLTAEIAGFVTQLKLQYDKKNLEPISISNLFIGSDSPIIEQATIHNQLISAIEIFKNEENQFFFDSLSKRNYGQALRRACTSSSSTSYDLLNTLLNYQEKLKFDINGLNKNNQNALHMAAIYNNERAYHLLRRFGLKDDIPDNKEKTAIEYADENGFQHLSLKFKQ